MYKSRQIILDVLVDDVHPSDGEELSLGYIVVCLPETIVPGRVAGRSVSVTSYTKDLGNGVGVRRWDKGRIATEECHIMTAYFARCTSDVDDRSDR